jgi:excisionase family DNA binding protein
VSDTPLMSVHEAAALLGFDSEYPVRRLVRSGELTAYRIRGRIRISRDAIDALLAASVVKPRPVPVRADPPVRRQPARQGAPAPWERRRAKQARDADAA